MHFFLQLDSQLVSPGGAPIGSCIAVRAKWSIRHPSPVMPVPAGLPSISNQGQTALTDDLYMDVEMASPQQATGTGLDSFRPNFP